MPDTQVMGDPPSYSGLDRRRSSKVLVLVLLVVQCHLSVVSYLFALHSSHHRCCPQTASILVAGIGAIYYVGLLVLHIRLRNWTILYGGVAIAAGVHGGLVLGM